MMDLSKFPLDNQICTMEVAISKTIEELRLEWKNTDPVLMAKGLRMPQFEIVDIVPSDCQESFQIGTSKLIDDRCNIRNQRFKLQLQQIII
ncbi:glycine receptor subunit alpha-2-like, partial [Aphis craccivora]